MSELLIAVAVFVAAFLLGSIPWGVIISRVFFHTDIREHGSGNIGTTNAMRTMGKAGGAAVFVLDFGKGLVAGLIALAALWYMVPGAGVVPSPGQLGYHDFAGVAFLGCVWGHIFSPWLKFKGGKGIAVAVGCLFVVFGWVGAVVELAVFAVVVACSRYVSAGSLAAAVACPFISAYYFLITGFSPVAWVCCVLAAVTVIWAHRGNIARLKSGTERRLGDPKEN